MSKEKSSENLAEIETKRLQRLIESNKEQLGDFELVRVGDAGYILQNNNHKPMAGNDWVFFDYDDTLVATTQVKEKRLELYREYLTQIGVNLPEEVVINILETTDKFSRWEEKPGGGSIYHANAHMVALQWISSQLKTGKEVNTDLLLERLKRIKTGQVEEIISDPIDPDPFRFDPSSKKLVLHGADKIWSKGLENVFVNSMINPDTYPETIDAAKEISSPHGSIHRFNTGVFTYGDPYYQLLKVFQLMQKNPDLAFSQIWLTRVPKGDFIVQAVKTRATAQLEQEYVSADLEEYPGEGMSFGSGYVLGQHQHEVIMVDDAPKELDSIDLSNSFLHENSGAEFIVVRSVRLGTKEQPKKWQVRTPFGELDFTSESSATINVAKVLLINLFLKQKQRLGEQDPRTVRTLEELKARGVVI